MKQWAESKNLPGQFLGSTGLKCLSQEELKPEDKRFEAWTTKKVCLVEYLLLLL
jgi:hypothetical protein